MPLLRRSEWPLIVYFLYTAALSLVLHLRPPIPAITIALNLVIIAGFFVLARPLSPRDRYFLGIFCDWCPVGVRLRPAPESPPASQAPRKPLRSAPFG
ncbi:MAG: hypothetical protein ABSH05_20095 [Bryobacteraceae bacterium]|jgi:hypothetical protein